MSEASSGVPIAKIHGHDALREQLSRAALAGTLPASLLLHGPRGVGKQRLALWLGQALLCQGPGERPCGVCSACRYTVELRHPDLHWYFPRPRLKNPDPSIADVRDDYGEAIADRVASSGLYEASAGTEAIYLSTVRAIVADAAMSPALASKKVFVVGDAERMVAQEGSDQAANAFLKLLEEPPSDTTIVLTSSEPGALLPTIRSRAVSVRVSRLSEAFVRAWLADPVVSAALSGTELPASIERRLEIAAGAPGMLIGGGDRKAAADAAQRLLDAALSDDATRFRTAFAQGASKARGPFANTLDALTILLHERTRLALERQDERKANAAARAMDAVERAKTAASGNVNPSLLSAALLRDLSVALR